MAIGAVLLFAMMSVVMVLRLGAVNPATLAAERVFSALSLSTNGKASIARIERNFLFSLTADDLEVETGDGALRLSSPSVKVREGLVSLIGKFLTSSGVVHVDVDNPNGSLRVPEDTGTSRSVELPSLIKRIAWRFSIHDIDFSVHARQTEASVGAGNAELLVKKGGSIGTVRLELPQVRLLDPRFSGNLTDIQLYMEDSGFLYARLPHAEGTFGRYTATFDELRAESRLSKGDYPLSCSVQSLQLDGGDIHLAVPLASGTLTLHSQSAGSLYPYGVPSLVHGTFSVSQLDFRSETFATQLPASTIALSKSGDVYLAAFAVNSGDTISIDAGKGQASVTGLTAQGALNTESGDLEVSVSGPKAAYHNEKADIRLADFLFSASGADLSLSDQSAQAQVEFESGENGFKGHIVADGHLSKDRHYRLQGTIQNATTNLFGQVFDGSFDFAWNPESKDGDLELDLESGGQISTRVNLAHLTGSDSTVTIQAAVNGLPLEAFDQTWKSYLPLLTPYYDEKTTARGNVYFSLDGGKQGQIQYDVTFSDLRFGQFRFRAGSTGSGLLEGDRINVDSITMGVENYRMEFQGFIDAHTFVPSGNFHVTNTESGQSLLDFDIVSEASRRYHYRASSARFPGFLLEGGLSTSREGFRGSGSMDVSEMRYPLTFVYTIGDQHLKATSGENIAFEGDIKNPLNLVLDLHDLPFPQTKHLEKSTVSGSFNAWYQSASNWTFDVDGFELSGIRLGPHRYTFSADAKVDPDTIDITSLGIDDGTTKFTGSISYEGTPILENVTSSFTKPFTFTAKAGDAGGQNAELYLTGKDGKAQVMVDIQNLDFARFSTDGGTFKGSFSMVGETDMQSLFTFAGTAKVRGQEREVESDVGFDGKSLTLSHLNLGIGSSHLQEGTLRFNPAEGVLDLSGTFVSDYTTSRLDPKGSSFDFTMHAAFAPFDKTLGYFLPEGDFLQLLASSMTTKDAVAGPSLTDRLRDHLFSKPLDIDLNISNLSFLGSSLMGVDHDSLHLSYYQQQLEIHSSLLDLSYGFGNGDLALHIDPSIGIGLDISGVANEGQLALKAENFHFALRLLNRLLGTPIVSFDEGVLRGTLYADGTPSNPEFFGNLTCDSLKIWNFYVPDYDILVKNAYFWIDESRIRSARTRCYAVSRIDGKTAVGQAQLDVQMAGLKLNGFAVTVWLPDEPVEFYCPVPDAKVELGGMLKGVFHLNKLAGESPTASGEVSWSDALIGIGEPRRCPPWYKAANVSLDMQLTTDTNVKIIYPNIDNPMVSFTLKEGEKLHFNFDFPTKKASAEGTLALRSGDIFYFQKDFFVTEGTIVLRQTPGGGVMPILNLRARLKDFDAEGSPVDIFLVLRDSTLDNLNPTFESTPPKTTEEIMSILGQNILPTTSYGQASLYSVASVASMASGVAERMGWIESSPMTNLSETIRNSLGLDVFSFRSAILQNFILDALPGSSQLTISPLARYLNNTSVFLGKYLANDIFLQAILHLSAVDPRSIKPNDSPFLVNDLALNFEITLEWENPLCTFRVFTTPNELSLTQILDTIGLSVTKRIVLF